MGWKLIMNGIRKPKTIFPFTAHPCRYNTINEYIATDRNPIPFDYCNDTSGPSRKVNKGFLFE